MRKNLKPLLKYYKGHFHLHKTGTLIDYYVQDIISVMSVHEKQHHRQIYLLHSALTTTLSSY